MKTVGLLACLCTAIGLAGCGLITGGGDTSRADRLGYLEKQGSVGIGGPIWWLLRQVGAEMVADESPEAALTIRGVHRVQVTHYSN